MQVTFAWFGDTVASSRLRAKIPQKELKRRGIRAGFDIVVYGKHWLTEEQLKPFKKRVFDICDDHFNNENGSYYHRHALLADAVTCNSIEMARIIKVETGVDAFVVDDPFEAPEQPAGIGNGYLWFGHQSNLKDVEPYPEVKTYTGENWTLEGQRKAIEECAAVVIPSSGKLAKSANRLIESVRCGRFVIANDLPAYREFSNWMWIGDIRNGMKWFEENQEEAIKRVRNCQDYVKERYSPKEIAQQWLNVLERIWP